MNVDNKLNYLIKEYEDNRKELEQRISQRDSLANQYIVACGAILALALTELNFAHFLFFLLPVLTLFYSIQIKYSYVIHNRIHKFITSYLEPEIVKLLSMNTVEKEKLCWETYCDVESKKRNIKTPGIREGFFNLALFVAPIISSILFFITSLVKKSFPSFIIPLSISVGVLLIFEIIAIIIIKKFSKDYERNTLNKFSEVDYIDPDWKKYIKEDWKKHDVKCRVVFLDRDGTINVDKVNTHKIEDLEYFNNEFEALKQLVDSGFKLIVVSNQDGIFHGMYTKKEMHDFNMKIVEDFKKHGIKISAIYYSPHETFESHFSFKPNPGMLLRASYEFNISLKDSFLIGDQLHDVIAAKRMDVKPILVKTGIYKDKLENQKLYNDAYPFIEVDNLTDAVKTILND